MAWAVIWFGPLFRHRCDSQSRREYLTTMVGEIRWPLHSKEKKISFALPGRSHVCTCVICTFRGGSLCSVGLDAPFGSGLLRPLERWTPPFCGIRTSVVCWLGNQSVGSPVPRQKKRAGDALGCSLLQPLWDRHWGGPGRWCFRPPALGGWRGDWLVWGPQQTWWMPCRPLQAWFFVGLEQLRRKDTLPVCVYVCVKKVQECVRIHRVWVAQGQWCPAAPSPTRGSLRRPARSAAVVEGPSASGKRRYWLWTLSHPHPIPHWCRVVE